MLINEEDVLAFLMLSGRSEAKARRLLVSPAGESIKESIENYAKSIREKYQDPTIDVLEYYRSQKNASKKKSGRR